LALQTYGEGVLLGADEAVTARDLFGERGDEALPVDGEVEAGTDASQQFGDMQGSTGSLEYVIGHIYLRQTLATAHRGGLRGAPAEATNGTELSIKRSLENHEERIPKIVRHDGTS
jgi:hypothetical protein